MYIAEAYAVSIASGEIWRSLCVYDGDDFRSTALVLTIDWAMLIETYEYKVSEGLMVQIRMELTSV